MLAETAANGASGCGTGVVPSGVELRTPTAEGWVGALEGVVAKSMALVALGELIEAKTTFSPKGGGESCKTFGVVVKILCLGSGDGDDCSGG